jgi:hypothetical protein
MKERIKGTKVTQKASFLGVFVGEKSWRSKRGGRGREEISTEKCVEERRRAQGLGVGLDGRVVREATGEP